MQRGSLTLVSRKEEPDVWQFRWSEKGLAQKNLQASAGPMRRAGAAE